MLQTGITIDLVHVHGLVLGSFLALWTKLLGVGVPILTMEHGYGGERGVAHRASSAFNRVLLLRFLPPDFVLLLNDGTRIEKIERCLRAVNIRYMTVLHGVDSDFFAPSAIESAASEFTILFPHRNIPVKRPDLALEVLGALLVSGDCPSTQLVFLCQESPELIRMVEAYGLTDSVRFVGVQSRTGVRDYMRQCDVVIGTSLESNMNRAIQEAMSCGKPVVVFDSGGTSELVRNMENGVLVEPGNIDEFAMAIATLFQRPELQKELGANARSSILRERNWQTRIDKEILAYACLVNGLVD